MMLTFADSMQMLFHLFMWKCRTLPMLVHCSSPPVVHSFLTRQQDCGWIFAQHFCNHLCALYPALKNVLNKANLTHEEVLMDIKHCFCEEIFTYESIAKVIHAHSELIHRQNLSHTLLVCWSLRTDPYVLHEFSNHAISGLWDTAAHVCTITFWLIRPTDLFDTRPTLSYQSLQTERPLSNQKLYDHICRTVLNKQNLQVLKSFLIFNKYTFLDARHSAQLMWWRHVLKINFYQPTKVALSFCFGHHGKRHFIKRYYKVFYSLQAL